MVELLLATIQPGFESRERLSIFQIILFRDLEKKVVKAAQTVVEKLDGAELQIALTKLKQVGKLWNLDFS